MVMLAEHYEYVIGGDPDRDTIDLAVVTAPAGRVVAHRSDQTGEAGYLRLLNWGREQGPGRRVWALEGTGSFAAGFVTVLARRPARTSSRSPAVAGHKERRATASTQSRLPGPRSPVSNRPPPVRVGCGRR